jgi:hypothetical protein
MAVPSSSIFSAATNTCDTMLQNKMRIIKIICGQFFFEKVDKSSNLYYLYLTGKLEKGAEGMVTFFSDYLKIKAKIKTM